MGTTLNVEAWETIAANNDDADSGIVWTEGQMPSTVNNSGRGMMAAVAKWKLDISGGIVAGGTSDAITLTTNRSISIGHIVNGFAVRFRASATNTGATTVAIDGLTAKDVKTQGGAALSAGAIVSGGVYDIAYSETATAFVLLNGTQDTSSFLTASSTATLTNKTFNANGTGNSISNIEVADFAAAAIVTEAEGLASSDNDTSLPTTGAVKDYVDTAAAGAGALSVNVQVFTSNDTYTPTSGMAYCRVRVQAPGGGGGGADTDASSDDAEGGGGGGGEYAEGWFSAATIGASQAVTIGAVGAAGASSGGDGGTGGTTSLGALITCIGGSGGTGANPTGGSNDTNSDGGAGGTGGSGGSIRIVGRRGADAGGTTNKYSTGDGAYRTGGASVLGIPGLVSAAPSGVAPLAGTGYGYGGGGAKVNDTTASLAGEAGGPGVIIIEEFIQ